MAIHALFDQSDKAPSCQSCHARDFLVSQTCWSILPAHKLAASERSLKDGKLTVSDFPVKVE